MGVDIDIRYEITNNYIMNRNLMLNKTITHNVYYH
jgi:hypothetical protein